MSDPPPAVSHSTARSVPFQKRVRKGPTAVEVIEARLNLLTTLIETTEGRTDLNPQQIKRRNDHLWEKAQIEIRMEAHKSSQTFAQVAGTAAASPQPRVSESSTVSDAISAHTMGLRFTSTPITQMRTWTVTDSKGPTNELPMRPAFTAVTSPNLQSMNQDLQMTLPLRPAQPRKKVRDRGQEKLEKRDKKREVSRDPIVPPSAASGGVPEPSRIYLSLATSSPPQTLSVPQHLLLVLDLNGTLLYRPNRHAPSHFVPRPCTQQFLNYALANFSVMVWSSALPKNVERMCERLFTPEERQKLVAIWGRDQLGLTKADANKRVQVYKRLERIWSDATVQGRHPLAGEGKGWHQGNTVLIDDSIEKSRSEPYNFLEVPEFKGNQGEDLDVLKDIAEYLAVLRAQNNVSSYVFRHPLVRVPRHHPNLEEAPAASPSAASSDDRGRTPPSC